ncbi:MAG TPA: DUF4340 domain-containing protein [Parvibaculum sp.]|uniref:DUF4340 domain-containing protein n=1 Tax=Parvibaculum sp. TaxID=2024848 RepID=UPI002CA3A648|nr:DUF4340 domain-containing protein [Parvibaculum sp.]HMM15213.1 DUF4340 domain-containing protein [Parvibaculum sp.]
MATDFRTVWTNRPLRNLLLLALATLVAVVAASFAVVTQERGVRVRFEPRAMFPGLETQLDRVSKVTYTLGRGIRGVDKITLERAPGGKWTVANRKNYPAQQDLVQKLLIGVSEINLYEPRTARAEWHRNLGLLAPEDLGTATRVEFFDAKGERMAALLAGKVPDQTGDARGQGMIYVRRDGEDQTYLARGRLPLFQSAQEWLDTKFLDVARSEIARVTLWADTDNPIVISRASADDNDFVLENIPKGRVTRGAPIVNGAATTIVDLTFDDAVPAGSLDFTAISPKAVFETFDGLRLTIELTGGGGALWAKVTAAADPAIARPGADLKAADAKAAEINARVKDWLYKLPQQAGNQLTQSMDQLTHEAGLEN